MVESKIYSKDNKTMFNSNKIRHEKLRSITAITYGNTFDPYVRNVLIHQILNRKVGRP